VLFAVPAYPPPVVGGLERQAHELARTLARRGTRVTVVSQRLEPGQPGDAVVDGVRVVRVPRLPGPLRLAAVAARMWRLRRDYRVVHVHNLSWFAVAVIAAARALGRPVLAKLPSSGEIGGLPVQTRRPLGGVWLRGFTRADAVAALSAESVAEIRAAGYPAERVFRVSNGVSSERFHPAPRAAEASGRPLRFVYAGRLSPEKGVAELLEAWPSVVAEAGRPVRLDLYGDGPMRDEVRARIEALDAGATVALHPPVDDVAAVLRAADVFVLPSYVEGNSNALLEAMATGLAVVSTRAGGTPFVVGAAGDAWLVPPRDAAALAGRMAALARDDHARAELGRAMLARVRACFDMEAVADAYLGVYRRLARGDRRVSALSLAAAEAPAADAP
jgi:glycosyltransferase involved in cell wall biosynthesis